MPEPDPRVSDEATGLPPLGEIGTDETMLVLAWEGGVGVVSSPFTHKDEPVRFLHLRGLAVGLSGDPEDVDWVQVHIAVPVEHAVDVASVLAAGGSFDETPQA